MIEWGKVIYADCMNEENGLPTLEDKSVDLCLTDPPWNIKYKGAAGYDKKNKKTYHTKSQAHYKDNYDNDWNLIWFKELKRICNKIIIAPGRQNLKWWYRNTDPKDIFIHYKPNGNMGSYVAHFNCFDPYLYFYEGSHKPYFSHNVFKINSTTGILQKETLIHTSPKNYELWEKIIKKIKPLNVIDPFLGSGTVALACTKLGIPWLGYELNEVYSQDINKRLKGCKKEPTQIGLMNYMGETND